MFENQSFKSIEISEQTVTKQTVSKDDFFMTDSQGRVLEYNVSVAHRDRPHPAVKILLPHERASSALSAKFR